MRAAEEDLAAARVAAEKSLAAVKEREKAVAEAQVVVEAARRASLIVVKPRSLLKAYALWLLLPFVWPGAYLFYLGRDAHAWWHTVSFGGFGIGI